MSATYPIAVQVTADGKIPIPLEVRQELGLLPLQVVYLRLGASGLVIQLMSRQEMMARVVGLMRANFSDMSADELHEGREDDEHRV